MQREHSPELLARHAAFSAEIAADKLSARAQGKLDRTNDEWSGDLFQYNGSVLCAYNEARYAS